MFRVLLLCFSMSTLYAQQMPGSEIYLFDLKNRKGQWILSNPKNITNHPGYDNQPFFHPDKPLLYFASADEDPRTNIVEYNLTTATARRITNTSEREYSPTVTPDKQFISCIIQRDNGAQDLGKYPIDGGDPEVIINTLTVGYHAWLNNSTVYIFVLGDPHALYRFTTSGDKSEVVEKSIGRSIHRVPRQQAISFVHKVESGKWFIKTIDEKNTIASIGETLPGREDLAWTPDGKLVMSDGENFFVADPSSQPLTWKEIRLESSLTLKGISRIAISSDGTKLAAVVSE